MKQTFRTELWRIIKFLLISLGMLFVMLPFNRLYTGLMQQKMSALTGFLLAEGYAILQAIPPALLHRYFTFRATEKWFIALPLMIIVTLLYGWLGNFMMALTQPSISAAGFAQSVNIRSALWVPLSYLFQRYVLYCHTTDTNGWYRRLHPADTEEGAFPDE